MSQELGQKVTKGYQVTSWPRIC